MHTTYTRDDELSPWLVLGVTLVILPVLVVLIGYTLSTLWDWFVVGTFGLPSLGIAGAAGLYVTVRYIVLCIPKKVADTHKQMTSDHLLELVIRPFVINGLFLGAGWIIHLFM